MAKRPHQVPGTDVSPYAAMMRRYTLATIRDPEKSAAFRADLQAWLAANPLSTWAERYAANDHGFLDTRCWGADHDFGDGLSVTGAMADRHLSNFARIIRPGGIVPARDIAGKDCCVVGCWCGEELLLLDAMGARRTDAIEEVPEYARWATRQLDAWDILGEVTPSSLYSLAPSQLEAPRYDFLFLSGMLYHVTDPIVALTIAWALVRPEGKVAIETSCVGGAESTAVYLGAGRVGWNWWAPTPECLLAMLADCGFAGVLQLDRVGGRATFVARRTRELPLIDSGMAGFSRPDIVEALKINLGG